MNVIVDSKESIDIDRDIIMSWDSRIEELLEDYLNKCEDRVIYNKNRAEYRKWLYIFFGVTTISFPLVLSILQPTLPSLLNQTLLVSSGILNGLSSFLNPSKFMEIYLASMNKFIELKTDIQLELTKHKKDRQNPSEYLKGISERFINYQQSTPFF
jgi:hypothetical protein